MECVPNMVCPLCGGKGPFDRWKDRWGRTHWVCPGCRLVFTDRAQLPTAEAEMARYRLHRNGPDQPGYVAFLRRAVDAVRPWRPAAGAAEWRWALDYGCGERPVLPELLREEGLECEVWDPFFFPEEPRHREFDVVLATEVVEHYFRPWESWRRLTGFVRTGGLLAVMTECREAEEEASFAGWWYANDATHVAFYHRETLAWLARKLGLEELATDDGRVKVFQKRRIEGIEEGR